jgi:hypothetical protein
MRPQLTFTCPEKWNTMSPREGGRHCDSCNIVVRDFSRLSNDEIIKEINSPSENSCGSFHAYQLQEPFTDKRNLVIRFYQRVLASPKKKHVVRSFQLGLAMLLLLVSGCHRRMSGFYAHPSRKQLRQWRKMEHAKPGDVKKSHGRHKVTEKW